MYRKRAMNEESDARLGFRWGYLVVVRTSQAPPSPRVPDRVRAVMMMM